MVYVLWFFCFSWYYVKSWTNAATLLLQTLKKPWYCGQSHGCGPFYKTLLFMKKRWYTGKNLCWCWVILFHLFFSFLIYFLDAILKISGHLNAEHVAYFLWTVCYLALHREWMSFFFFFNDFLESRSGETSKSNQDVVCFTPNELLCCSSSI